jgi:hypothetical protein
MTPSPQPALAQPERQALGALSLLLAPSSQSSRACVTPSPQHAPSTKVPAGHSQLSAAVHARPPSQTADSQLAGVVQSSSTQKVDMH